MKTSGLERYRDKRRAGATSEPFSTRRVAGTQQFVVHHHLASREHWDLRFEVDGVLWSWAVPKGPAPDPATKRFAVRTEDHPLDYAWFEGVIPEGNYGAGAMVIWDRGRCLHRIDPAAGFEAGKLLFELRGFKLQGTWTLVRTKQEWLLIKERDAWVREGQTYPVDSVVSGLTAAELAMGHQRQDDLRRAAGRAGGLEPAPARAELTPMLCEPGEPFSNDAWLFEVKYDGYRLLLHREGPRVRLLTRGGHDIARSFPEIAAAAAALPCEEFVIDGELVITDGAGLPDFARLQQRAQLTRAADVARTSQLVPASLQAFDVLAVAGLDLRTVPLIERKQILERLLPSCGYLAWVDHVEGAGEALFEHAEAMGLEGIVGKQRSSTYQSRRSPAWRKIPALRTEHFAVVGHAPDRNGREPGTLILAGRRGDTWVPVGRVAVALPESDRDALAADLAALARERVVDAQAGPGEATWVRPTLVATIRFKNYTRGGSLRQPVLLAMAGDIAADCCRSGPWGNDAVTPADVREDPDDRPRAPLTNADKLFWPDDGLAKGDLVAYYRAIAPWMLPWLADRPVVLTRFPDGIHGKSFYQHRAPSFLPDWIPRVPIWSDSEGEERDYLLIENEEALAWIANLAAIPIHVWNARSEALQHPDWCVLDLDPKGAPFRDVVKVARVIHALCEQAAIPDYLKTSGSTGLHVLIPTGGRLTHEQARDFGELLARIVVARAPELATVQRAVERREGKVYVDFLQNGHGKTIAAPFCVRPLPGAPVSMPLRWSELSPRTSPERYTIRNALRRLRALGFDPLAPLLTNDFDPMAALGRLAQQEA